jgi:predicted AlkP superfamily phosphohydrolase/phosphomutase
MMNRRLAVIGIDSLDPIIVLRYREHLPNFSRIIDDSPTFISKSVFPVDTIPAWATIFTGLRPGNHGLLYVYDVFDPHLSDLAKLDLNSLVGKTFWDHASNNGLRSVVVFPILMYPPWQINGVMISKSPFDRRRDTLKTETEVKAYPAPVMNQYGIPDRLESIWGGFPGRRKLQQWADLGKDIIEKEKSIGLNLLRNEKWDLYFIYFSLLDIIQHRLWRFFDEKDPDYLKDNVGRMILDYYMMFDAIVGEFLESDPNASWMIISDHGHKSRPIVTLNINEQLRETGYLVAARKSGQIRNMIRKTILEVANKVGIEHLLIKVVTSSGNATAVGKSVYSSAGAIDRERSKAFLSTFAGIKSYSQGGIEINKQLMSNEEYELVRRGIIESLSNIKISDGRSPFVWAAKREEIDPGAYSEEIYPDIVFQLRNDYGVGWELYSRLEGKAYDHGVASGGHSGEAVFLLWNATKSTHKSEVRLIDVAPTILDSLDVDLVGYGFDGESIFR